MKPEVKKQWVEALRSGKYKQGTKFLNRNGRFCCLGVLCELSGVCKELKYDRYYYGGYYYGGNDGLLPRDVREWAGIKSASPIVRYTPSSGYGGQLEQYSLVTLNDELQLTFEQIADIIEEQL